MDNFVELEYKYKADNVKLEDFVQLMELLKPNKRLDISSWDFYYTKGVDEFVRYRKSAVDPELTIKRKIKTTNNWERVEVDLPLNRDKITDSGVDKFLELLDYKLNFKLYKTCMIFWLDSVNYVYYITYNENLEELGRFIEVEVNKDKVAELNRRPGKSGALFELNYYSDRLSKLGLSSQNRMKKSLYELYSRS